MERKSEERERLKYEAREAREMEVRKIPQRKKWERNRNNAKKKTHTREIWGEEKAMESESERRV